MDLVDRIVQRVVSLLLRRWPDPGGTVDREDLAALVEATFRALPDAVDSAQLDAWDEELEALGEGVLAAEDRVPVAGAGYRSWAAGVARGLVVLARSEDVEADVVRARVVSLVEREVVTAAVTGQSQADDTVARVRDLFSVFTPERDACLVCTSYAGAVVRGGGEFEPVRDYTGRGLGPTTIPVHPRCRCGRRMVQDRGDADARSAVLVREAERSILRQDALPSESDRARERAAQALLDAGTQLAKTVRERAQRRINRQRRDRERRR